MKKKTEIIIIKYREFNDVVGKIKYLKGGQNMMMLGNLYMGASSTKQGHGMSSFVKTPTSLQKYSKHQFLSI